MKNYSEDEISSLIKRFEAGHLPKVEWTHEAHLVVAVWYASHYSFEEAMPRVRNYITRHNTSVGTPNSDSEGYHETITRFWLQLAYLFLTEHENTPIEHRCNSFINSRYSRSDFPLKFYPKETLFSVYARKNWVEPETRAKL